MLEEFELEGAFDLPEGVAAVLDVGEVVEGSVFGEEATFFFVGAGALEEVGEGGEGVVFSFC